MSTEPPRDVDPWPQIVPWLVGEGMPVALLGCRAIEHWSIRTPSGSLWLNRKDRRSKEEEAMIFVGDDWAEAHHDVWVMDEAGSQLAYRRLPEGIGGVSEFHGLVGGFASDPAEVVVGIEKNFQCSVCSSLWTSMSFTKK